MRAGGVVSLKRLGSVELLRNNKLTLFMCILFVAGVCFGSIFVTKRSTEISGYLFNGYVSARQNGGFFSIFISSLFKKISVCAGLFVFGASVIGVVLSPAFCATLGMYFGFIASYAYGQFALKGVAFNAIILIPAELSFALCVFFSAKESFKFSAVLLKLTLPKSRPLNVSVEFKTYCGKYILILIFLIAVSLIDTAVSTSFLKFFSF